MSTDSPVPGARSIMGHRGQTENMYLVVTTVALIRFSSEENIYQHRRTATARILKQTKLDQDKFQKV